MLLCFCSQQKSGLLSSLPPPAHVTNLTSLVPQSLSKAAATMKPKTSASKLAHSTKPLAEPARTVLPVKHTPSAGFVNSRLLTLSTSAASNSVTGDSDEEVGGTADFFSLDAAETPAVMPPVAFRSSEAADVRWRGSTSHVKPAATFVPPDSDNIPAASADIVWNATTYTTAVMGDPPAHDAAMVCKPLVLFLFFLWLILYFLLIIL